MRLSVLLVAATATWMAQAAAVARLVCLCESLLSSHGQGSGSEFERQLRWCQAAARILHALQLRQRKQTALFSQELARGVAVSVVGVRLSPPSHHEVKRCHEYPAVSVVNTSRARIEISPPLVVMLLRRANRNKSKPSERTTHAPVNQAFAFGVPRQTSCCTAQTSDAKPSRPFLLVR